MQNRVIRLEQRPRVARVLDPALAGELAAADAVKRAEPGWQPDDLRV